MEQRYIAGDFGEIYRSSLTNSRANYRSERGKIFN